MSITLTKKAVQYCVYCGNRRYLYFDVTGPMIVVGMCNAYVFDSYDEAVNAVYKCGMNGVSGLRVVRWFSGD